MSQSFTLRMAEDRFLRGNLYKAKEECQGLLLICHGYKGFKDWGFFPYASHRLSQHFDTVVFNFSHNGVGADLTEFTELEKFAGNTFSREQEDIRFILSALEKGEVEDYRHAKDKPIFLLGHSRGGGNALIYAFDHPHDIAGVVSWNGITDTDLFSHQQKEDMRKNGRAYILNSRTKQMMPLNQEILDDLEANRDRFNILERAKQSPVPIVLIQGTEDGRNLQEGSSRLTAIRPDIPWRRITGANHTFRTVHPFQGTTSYLDEAIMLTEDWLLNTVKSGEAR
ncbi:alpha/beta hydrolase family protein [Gorillibacterium massiliense]|uniref:alpha/beta hydrolase family protein n=1 Tax=Gorillibacterium massiliense TaxID=1280390 RepID=UPI0004B0BDE7|nr:alpha/beta fold hydrolase [Gorillibacterium massiliense]